MGARAVLAAIGVALGLAVAASVATAGTLAITSTRCDDGGACSGKSIWLLNDDGTGLHRLSGVDPGPSAPDRSWHPFADEWPSWSPSGGSVLFRREDRSTGEVTLQIQPTDGGVPTQVGPAHKLGIRYYEQPEWSPDGKSILFLSPVADEGGMEHPSEIHVMRMDGSVRQVTHGPPYYTNAQFSRDGARILAQSLTPEAVALTSFNLDGGDAHPVYIANQGPLTPNGWRFNVLEYALSPDGRSVALNQNGQVASLTPSTGIVKKAPEESMRLGMPNRFAFVDEPYPRLIRGSDTHEGDAQVPLQTIPLNGSWAQPTTLVPGAAQRGQDSDPAWHSSGPAGPVPDITPPAVELVAGAPVTGARKRVARGHPGYPLADRGAVGFQAFDTSGVARVEASIAQVTRVHRHTRCRHLGSRWFGSPRSCARRRWRVVQSATALATTMGRLPAGRFRLRMRVRDAHGRAGIQRGVRFSLAPPPRAKRHR